MLPDVVHVKVTWSPSRAGFVNPVISGFSGTPARVQENNMLVTKPNNWEGEQKTSQCSRHYVVSKREREREREVTDTWSGYMRVIV